MDRDVVGAEVVVITGASAGVGRATVRKFARHGARIGLVARGLDGLEAARKEVEELGGKALVVPVDVANADQVEAAAAQIEAELGKIDIWINNAMASVFSPIKEMAPEEFRRVTEVTVQGFCDSLWSELIHDRSAVRVTMVQLPALNTPQFGWVKTRLPRKAQPVPPIFQPEVAAEAIYFAAHNPRREFYVGLPAVKAIIANKIAPGLLDHILARTGYDSQQYDGPENPNRSDNLWQPVAGDHGAHGGFDARARSWSPQLWTSEHRGWLALGVAALLPRAWPRFSKINERACSRDR